MQKPSFDPGLTQQVTGKLRRAIDKDGSFSVERRGSSWRDFHPYLHLINASWPVFLGLTFAGYVVVNTIFALAYFSMDVNQLQGTAAPTPWLRFLNDFFFSAHTLTTVGYGNFAPTGLWGNSIAAFEAMVGVMGFALATGLLFGRVAKPSARIGFSERALIAPYQDSASLQFRVVNLRSNTLIELQASLLLMTVEGTPGALSRKFRPLPLERESVAFFPLTWTVVHPIDEASPLFNKSAAELEQLQAEVMILIKAFDETFSQTVHSRYSYRFDEIEWNARFEPAFSIGGDGRLVLDVSRVGAFARPEAAGK